MKKTIIRFIIRILFSEEEIECILRSLVNRHVVTAKNIENLDKEGIDSSYFSKEYELIYKLMQKGW